VSAATAGTTVPISRPRRRLILTLLTLSVALNLFFVAGAAWMRLHGRAEGPTPEQRYQQMAAELDLDPQQRIGFDRYVAAMRARTANMREQVGPLIAAAWQELGKPQADQAQVMRLFDEAAEKRREFQREATTQTLAFLAVLSPAQRSKFVAIARDRRAPWRDRSP
jgi:Spy/CpxP family protein refolding chaperone